MPRLKVSDAGEHGKRTGTDGKRKEAAKRASRSRSVGRATTPPPTIKKKTRVFLTKDEQALLILRYMQLPKQRKGSKERGKALEALCKEFDVNIKYPAELCAKLSASGELPSRDGVGGAPEKITEEEEVLLINTLETHAYELTYRQLGTLTGIPATTIWRFVKEHEGWREVRKGTRPKLSEKNQEARAEWAKDHLEDDWELQIDIDEKLFYAWSSAGTLKIPPEHEKPKSELMSKRFIPKVMMLAAVGKPCEKHKWDGKLGIWEVGVMREALRGDSRTGLKRGDMIFESGTLDHEGWVKMLLELVFPAIRTKLPRAKVVKLQFDNAGPHKTHSEVDPRLAAAMSKGKPRIVFVEQIAQSPCTNLCDLGFFRSIDSRLPKLRSFSLLELISQIKDAFAEYPSAKLSSLVIMKARVTRCIADHEGANDFKLPHRKNV